MRNDQSRRLQNLCLVVNHLGDQCPRFFVVFQRPSFICASIIFCNLLTKETYSYSEINAETVNILNCSLSVSLPNVEKIACHILVYPSIETEKQSIPRYLLRFKLVVNFIHQIRLKFLHWKDDLNPIAIKRRVIALRFTFSIVEHISLPQMHFPPIFLQI